MNEMQRFDGMGVPAREEPVSDGPPLDCVVSRCTVVCRGANVGRIAQRNLRPYGFDSEKAKHYPEEWSSLRSLDSEDSLPEVLKFEMSAILGRRTRFRLPLIFRVSQIESNF
jgi:hypothetical protein